MPFCLECACTGAPQNLGNGKVHQEKNWECPLLGGNICETCCYHDLAGGMGSSGTLRRVMEKTGKSGAEVHAMCVACPHGGPLLEEPHKLIMARAENGEMVKSGAEFEACDKEFKESWAEQLKRLKENRTEY